MGKIICRIVDNINCSPTFKMLKLSIPGCFWNSLMVLWGDLCLIELTVACSAFMDRSLRSESAQCVV